MTPISNALRNYGTQLSPEEESAFQQWYAQMAAGRLAPNPDRAMPLSASHFTNVPDTALSRTFPFWRVDTKLDRGFGRQ